MATRQRKKSWFPKFLWFSAGILFLIYFGFHGLYGNRGLYAHEETQRRISKLEVILETLEAERADLQYRIDLIAGPSRDHDFVDELARAQLNMAHPDEWVIFVDLK